MRKLKQETYTSRVMEALRKCDDFMTAQQLAEKLNHNIHNALRELNLYGAVDWVEQGGKLWWFALPPESDTRSRVIEERTPETGPRRPKRRKP